MEDLGNEYSCGCLFMELGEHAEANVSARFGNIFVSIVSDEIFLLTSSVKYVFTKTNDDESETCIEESKVHLYTVERKMNRICKKTYKRRKRIKLRTDKFHRVGCCQCQDR